MLFSCVYVHLHKIPLFNFSFIFPHLQSSAFKIHIHVTFLSSNLNHVLTEGKGVFPLMDVTKSAGNNTKSGGTIDSFEGGGALQRHLDS